MMNLFKKIKKNILIYDLLFASANIIINFILYLMNMRFRLWFIILIIFVSIVGFIIGIFQQIYLSSDNKNRTIILSLLGIIPIIILILISLPIVYFIAIFSYKPEHTTMLDNKKYVAVVSSFLHVVSFLLHPVLKYKDPG